MKHKKWVFSVSTLLVLLFSMTACSDKPSSIDSSIKHVDENTFNYTVKNNTDESITYDFTSGQRFDFTLSKEDKIVYQLSSVSMYPQVLGSVVLGADSEMPYEFKIPSELLSDGTYTINAWLTTADGKKHEAEIEHTFSN